MTQAATALSTAQWRREVFALYADVRDAAASGSPALAHAHWRTGRDRLFAGHAASPLPPSARENFTGLTVAAYNPDFRFEADIDDDGAGQLMEVPTGTDGVVPFERLGSVVLDGVGRLALWRLKSYGGGLFLPLRDGSSGVEGGSYGGGRYVLDTIKGAHLGERDGRLVVDLNFAYNPSCAYDEAWACPLPGPDNRLEVSLPVGELYTAY
ncbi:hypothetical protein SAMN04488693_11467 [Arthrobacter subterraneus]|uniref:DUF1684 domain-containing protein n=1 Tax=Arthrobacter subterraneus TaxID=335973 RepID=A0A1G8LNU8_9MICC|nr:MULTISPECIES: DUF1684 domain-containing protein [Arthrobacter]SDI57392.1 hypothetical protein SAMN04488693_11467 [Arthrobacter subterraneus]